jgi:hypothetical protein
VVTGADGHFKFEGLPVGADITLVMAHPDYHAIQTGTHVLPDEGLQRITFQAVTPAIYGALAAIVGRDAGRYEKYCQMVTTVTRVGKSIYDMGAHGEAEVVVTIDPPLPAENGPVYFNAMVIPEPGLTQTTEDGGVLFSQVPPGDYTWTASKAGAEFRPGAHEVPRRGADQRVAAVGAAADLRALALVGEGCLEPGEHAGVAEHGEVADAVEAGGAGADGGRAGALGGGAGGADEAVAEGPAERVVGAAEGAGEVVVAGVGRWCSSVLSVSTMVPWRRSLMPALRASKTRAIGAVTSKKARASTAAAPSFSSTAPRWGAPRQTTSRTRWVQGASASWPWWQALRTTRPPMLWPMRVRRSIGTATGRRARRGGRRGPGRCRRCAGRSCSGRRAG